jgi:hypothetical protein
MAVPVVESTNWYGTSTYVTPGLAPEIVETVPVLREVVDVTLFARVEGIVKLENEVSQFQSHLYLNALSVYHLQFEPLVQLLQMKLVFQ